MVFVNKSTLRDGDHENFAKMSYYVTIKTLLFW